MLVLKKMGTITNEMSMQEKKDREGETTWKEHEVRAFINS